jgi:HK97 family phage portal protein
MNLLDRVKNVFSPAPAPTAWDLIVAESKALPVSEPFDLTNQKLVAQLTGQPSSTGLTVSADSALGVSAFWSCIRVLSETIGALPWGVYESDATGAPRPVKSHPLLDLLNGEPNQYMNGQEMRETQMVNLAMMGDAYSIVDRRPNGDPISILPISSDLCRPKLRPRTHRLYYDATLFGEHRELERDQVWQVKGFGGTGLNGFSALRYGRDVLGMAQAADRYAATFFRQGGNPAGVVEMKEWMTEEQYQLTKQRMADFWQGLGNGHKIQTLEGGMTFRPISPPPEDVELLLTRTFSVQEVCRLMRVPPHMVADLTKSAFTNIEQQSLDFVTYTLLPYLKRWENTGNRRLFRPSEVGKLFIKFNFEGLLRADSAARAALYAVFLDKGVMNRNEARALENLPRSSEAGMDSFTVQSQMVPIEKLGQAPAPATPATPATGA